MPLLPDDLIAATLNGRQRRHERGHIDDNTIPRLHVSSLIKSGSADFFCPREFVMRYMERRETGGGGVSPKFELLWAVGHFYGNYIVQKFIDKNPEYAKFAWGDWTCRCGYNRLHRQTLPDATCERCEGPMNVYLEVDLFDPKRWVVGHADLIMLVNDTFFIYEFKSIDRADIVFDKITEPLGDHLLQASHYYYMLKAEGKKVSPRIRFVYVDRSMEELYTRKPFREVYGRAITADRLGRIYQRAKSCHSSIRLGKLPERKCKDIECSRAKQCSVAVSCFARTQDKITRIPLESTPQSRPAASTVRPSITRSGMVSRSGPTVSRARIRRVSSKSRKN
jgi:hypothetical protein